MADKENVLFIATDPNFLRNSHAVEPMALIGLAAVLEEKGFFVQIHDLAVSPLDTDTLSTFSRIGVTTNTPTYPGALELLKVIKAHTDSKHTKTMIGGPHVTVFREKILEDGWDTACAGECENIVADIVTGGLTGFYDGGFVQNLDALPIPARHLIVSEKYKRSDTSEPSVSIMTSRGCPFACIYCAKEISGRKVRNRSVPHVVAEIKNVTDQIGIKNFVFYDDTFTLDKNRTLKLCSELEKLNISWICNTRVDKVDEEIMSAMCRGGCREISYGLESANEGILRAINKGGNVTAEQAARAVQLAKDAGIRTRVFFMFGFPWDTSKSVDDILNFLYTVQPDSARLSLVVPLPGSELYANASAYGIPLPKDLREYVYLDKQGPRTFTKRTLYLSESQFNDELTRLTEGMAAWATRDNSGVMHVTNVQ